MEDEEKQSASQKDPEEQNARSEDSVDAKVKAAVDAMKAELENKYKSEMAGLNRKNTELTKELDDVKKAQMNEKERVEYERQQERAEFEKAKADLKAEQMDLAKTKAITITGLPEDFKDRLVGETEDALLLDAQKFKALWDENVQQRSEKMKNETLVTTSKKPVSGKPSETLSIESYFQMNEKERYAFIKEHPQEWQKIANEVLQHTKAPSAS